MTREQFDEEAEKFIKYGNLIFGKEANRNFEIEEKFWELCKDEPIEFLRTFFDYQMLLCVKLEKALKARFN